MVTEIDHALTEYHDPEQGTLWQLVVRVLRELPVQQAVAGAEVSERTVKQARAGKLTGKTARATTARAKLTPSSTPIPTPSARLPAAARPRGTTRAYLDRLSGAKPVRADIDAQPTAEAPICPGCGQPIIKRVRRGPAPKWYSDTCRKRGERNGPAITEASGRQPRSPAAPTSGTSR